MARRHFAALALCALMGARPASAGGIMGGYEFRVNTYTTGAQDDPAVAVQGTTALVAWESAGQDGSGDGVFVRRAGMDGAPTPEFQVNTYTTGAQDDATIAALADGTFVTLWESTGQDGSGEGLFGRLLSPRGEPAGEEFAVNTRTAGNQDAPAVAGFPAGGFVVVWEDLGADDDGETVMAQRFDAGGGRMGAEFRVNGGTDGDQYEPAVAAHEAGFVVAWASAADGGGDGSGAGVVARRFDLQGVALGGDIQVNTYTTGDQAHPAVAVTAGGGFVVAWASDGQDGAAEGIFAQRFDVEGAPLGEELQVNSYTTGVQLWPVVAADGDGAYLVVWESAGQDGSSDAVMARLFGADGAAQGGERRVNVTTAGAQEDAAVAADARGGYIVVWESADGSSDGVAARRAGPVAASPVTRRR